MPEEDTRILLACVRTHGNKTLLAHTSAGTEVELGGTQREWNRDLVMVAGEEVSPAQMWVVPCAESPTHSAELGVPGIACGTRREQ